MKGKEFFSLNEVSEITGVPPHVIRYWETEFAQVKSVRDGVRQQMYSRKCFDVIIRIKHLLFDEKYTIADTKIELAKEFD
jgi:DNA-binding transcriptional MerR regulator